MAQPFKNASRIPWRIWLMVHYTLKCKMQTRTRFPINRLGVCVCVGNGEITNFFLFGQDGDEGDEGVCMIGTFEFGDWEC